MPFVLQARSLVLAALLSVSIPASVLGQLCFTWSGEMRGTNVVPPTASLGYASVVARFAGCDLCSYYVKDSLEVEIYRPLDLQGVPTAVRIHRGTEGTNGPMVVEFPVTAESFPSHKAVYWDEADCEALGDTSTYIVIATDLYPDGEIRSQLNLNPIVPVVEISWGLLRTLFRSKQSKEP